MIQKKLLSLLAAATFILGTAAPGFASEVKVEKVANSSTVVVQPKMNNSHSSGSESIPDSSLDEKNAKITKEEARKIAFDILKKCFDLDVDEKKFEIRVQFRQDYVPNRSYIWEIDFHKNTNQKSVNIAISIDAQTGDIARISNYSHNFTQSEPVLASITKEQARQLAEAFIKKVNAKAFEKAEYVEMDKTFYKSMGYNVPHYEFAYVQKINDIPFATNVISVQVDGRSSSVTSYYCNWDNNVEFPSPEGAISKEEAIENLKSQSNMKLQYIPVRNRSNTDGKTESVRLVYTPDFTSGSVIDALSGEVLNYAGETKEESIVKELTKEQKEQLVKNIKPVEKSSGEIDSKKAEKIINSIANDLLNGEYEIQLLEYRENEFYGAGREKSVWSAQVMEKGDPLNFQNGGNITIDAATGELFSISRHYEPKLPEEGLYPVLTWEQAYDKVMEVIAKYYPDKLDNINTKQQYQKVESYYNGVKMPEVRYYFNFHRTVEGIEYNDNRISIEIDLTTGSVNYISCAWDEQMEFPKAEGNISKEAALEKFFNSNSFNLMYTKFNENKDKEEVKLVYSLTSPMTYSPISFIDAFTGNEIMYDGNEVVEESNGFEEKIKGHWAEKPLSILAYQNIIDASSLNDLDKKLTRLEFLKMIVNAKGNMVYSDREAIDLKFTNITRDDKDYNYFQLAVRYGFIENTEKEFDKEEKITREEAAEMLVKLLGYDSIATAKGIFTLPFEDADEVDKSKIGYVAVGKGLGIFEGSNGKFRPKDNITLAEAAAAIYKALNKNP
ncbi:MAG: YcdB/YcdC domain-containing protein [Bacillota bacterium]